MYYDKYIFSFDSIHGVPMEIHVAVDGYSGSVIQRRLGAAPVLKTRKDGRIISTSIELLAECQVDGEFEEFYTSDPRAFYVDVLRGDDGEGQGFRVWQGYVTPEIYSAPYIAPPYDVRIYANDGLGELKLYDWEAAGSISIKEALFLLLEKTGIEYASMWLTSSIRAGSGTTANFFDNTYINLDYMVGETYYDVLQVLLESLNMDVMYYFQGWLFLRDTDIAPASNGSLSVVSLYRNISSSVSTLYNVVESVGQMGVADLWPIGHMTKGVEPAKKKVVVEAPWHFVNAFGNPDMATRTIWGESGTVNFSTGYYALGRMNVGASSGTIYQNFTLKRFTRSLKVTVRALAAWVSNSYLDGKTRGVGVYAVCQNTGAGTMTYYSPHGNSRDWGSSYAEPDMSPVDVKQGVGNDLSGAQEISFDIPSPGVDDEVFLKVAIVGYGVYVTGASVVLEDNMGYRDTLLLNNGARGEADPVEITGGRMLSSSIIAEPFYGGLLMDQNGNAIYSFSDIKSSSKDFLALNALNRAHGVAAPRLKISGRFNSPADLLRPPIVIKDGNRSLRVLSFEWDLYNEEIQIDSVALPTATLVVDSETIIPIKQ